MESHSKDHAPKMFNEISNTYDKINKIVSFGMDQNWRKTLVDFLPKRQKLKALDLATGTADQMIALLPYVDQIIGIDLAEEMMNIGKTKLQNEKKVSFQVADAQDLPFEDNTFDAASFSFGIRNVVNPLQSLHEIYRVLKPSGRCLILEFSMPNVFIKPFYLVYLRYILPYLGSYFSQNTKAYKYLNQTIESFPSGSAFLNLMKQANFSSCKQVKMALGAVSLYIGEK